MEDISQLLNSETNSTTADITNQVMQLMAWIIIPSVILTIIVVVFFVLYMLRKRKIENAIFEIRDILRDMQRLQTPSAIPHQPEQAQPAASDSFVPTSTSEN